MSNIIVDTLLGTGAAFGGFAALVAAFTWFGQVLVNNFFNKNLETHKGALSTTLESHKSSLNESLETHKNSLATQKDVLLQELSNILQESRQRFSSLHEQRIKIIPELYSRIQEAISMISALLARTEFDNKTNDMYLRSIDELQKAHAYFQKNKIYFRPDFCSQLNNFNQTLEEPIRVFTGLVEINENSPSIEQQNKTAQIQSVENDFNNESNNILLLIENEFREILGSSTR